MIPKPVALSCGEPAGIGSEIALKAWQALRTEEVFFWMGDPAHLPAGAHYEIIDTPEVAAKVMKDALPVLAFDDGDTPEESLFIHKFFKEQIFLINDHSSVEKLLQYIEKPRKSFFDGVAHTANKMIELVS